MLPNEQTGRLIIELFVDVLTELLADLTAARAQTPERELKVGDTVKITTTAPGTFTSGERMLIRRPTVHQTISLDPMFDVIPAVNATTVVRNDGKITLPLLGNVPADGLTPAELRQILEGRLQKYVSMPHVTVELVK